MRQLRKRICPAATQNRSGQALVEFALVALVLYLLLAAIITFGQLTYASHGVQQAADLLARELSHAPLTADLTLERALSDETDMSVATYVLPKIYDKKYLVLYIGPADPVTGRPTFQGEDSLLDLMAGLPLVNQQLVPLMMFDTYMGHQVLRYPGGIDGPGTIEPAPAYNDNPNAPDIIRAEITVYNSYGEETPVVKEIAADGSSPFQISSAQRGVVALQINYPYQSAAMSSYETSPDGPFEPNGGLVWTSDSGAEEYGLHNGFQAQGRQAAWGKDVRPFSKLLSATAIYRRELFVP